MEEDIPLTFSEKALEFAIAVPDIPVFQFTAGFRVALVLSGLLVLMASSKPRGARSRPAIRSKSRVKLSAEELRAVRTKRVARNRGDMA